MGLEADLLQSHARDDRVALVDLYTQAADLRVSQGNTDAACFYLTHAYIFALEMAHPATSELKQRLVEYGREK